VVFSPLQKPRRGRTTETQRAQREERERMALSIKSQRNIDSGSGSKNSTEDIKRILSGIEIAFNSSQESISKRESRAITMLKTLHSFDSQLVGTIIYEKLIDSSQRESQKHIYTFLMQKGLSQLKPEIKNDVCNKLLQAVMSDYYPLQIRTVLLENIANLTNDFGLLDRKTAEELAREMRPAIAQAFSERPAVDLFFVKDISNWNDYFDRTSEEDLIYFKDNFLDLFSDIRDSKLRDRLYLLWEMSSFKQKALREVTSNLLQGDNNGFLFDHLVHEIENGPLNKTARGHVLVILCSSWNNKVVNKDERLTKLIDLIISSTQFGNYVDANGFNFIVVKSYEMPAHLAPKDTSGQKYIKSVAVEYEYFT
jgi:hypothetical protein